MLREEFGVAEVIRGVKSNYSAPADPDIVDELAPLAGRRHRDRRLRQLLVVQSA